LLLFFSFSFSFALLVAGFVVFFYFETTAQEVSLGATPTTTRSTATNLDGDDGARDCYNDENRHVGRSISISKAVTAAFRRGLLGQ